MDTVKIVWIAVIALLTIMCLDYYRVWERPEMAFVLVIALVYASAISKIKAEKKK